MAKLLYIDTSGSIATVAIAEDGAPIAVAQHENANEQAAVLNGMVATVTEQANLQLKDIDGISVCAGPGSYTGLRVGLSNAKGLCYALDKPILLFNKLDLLAAEHVQNRAFAIALKARQGEYFYAVYDAAGKISTAPKHAMEAEIIEDINNKPDLVFVTDEQDFALTENKIVLPTNSRIDMASWAKLAAERFASKAFDDLAYCEPFYLKAAYTTQSKK